MKATITILGAILELEAPTSHELWQKMAFYQSLPTVCPVDATPTRFAFRSPQGNDYYEVANTNPDYYIWCHVGQKKADLTLYCDGVWLYWDWKNKVELELAVWNTLTPAGIALQRKMQGEPLGPETEAQPMPEAEKQPVKPPATLDKRVAPELTAARHIFHALGSTIYQDEWDAKRSLACKARGLDSSRDADLATIEAMILKLEKVARTECYTLAEKDGWAKQPLADLCNELQAKTWSIEEMKGVPLSNLLTELRLPRELEDELPF